MVQQPSYYSILTANVRYDSRLKPNEKLMYSEITALSNKYGYCTANNTYFANLYSKNKLTVSRWISDLKKLGYLKVQIALKGKRVIGRRIYPIDKKINRGIDKKINTYIQKNQSPTDKKVKDNTTSKNTTRINNTSLTYKQKIIKDLEVMNVQINTFVWDDIDDWLKTYDPKLILKALHMVGSRNPNPRYVITDATSLLQNGCQQYQQQSHNRKPIPSPKLPDWAKSGHHVKLHRTSKKMQQKIQKQLHDLGYRGDKK